MVWRQAAGQPHQLDIATRLSLKATAGRDAVQVAVDEELQQHSRMVARATGSGGHTTLETERRKIELLDEEVDDTDQVILADPVLQTIREKRDLVSVDAIDETCHPGLPLPCGSLPRDSVSTQPRPRLCENSIGHGWLRNSVCPRAILRSSVPMPATAGGLTRKSSLAISGNLSFHTASAHCRRSWGARHCHAAAPNRSYMASCSMAWRPKVGSADKLVVH